MTRICALDKHLSGSVATSGTTRNLADELECPLGAAEIGQVERGVGRGHAHQRHAGIIVSLGDHLGADQDVDLSVFQPFQNAGMASFPGSGVAVHPGYAGVWEKLFDFFFDTLGAAAEKGDVRPAATGTDAGRREGEIAIVAVVALPGLVVGEGHGAVGATEDVAAVAAEKERGETAAVEEQKRLAFSLQVFAEGGDEFRCAGAVTQVAGIEDMGFRKGQVAHPFREAQVTESAVHCRVIGGYQRRCRAQDDHCPFQLSPDQ